MSENNYVFLATQLTKMDQDERAEEGIAETRIVPMSEVLSMVKSGEITDSNTIAPLTMAALELGLFNF